MPPTCFSNRCNFFLPVWTFGSEFSQFPTSWASSLPLVSMPTLLPRTLCIVPPGDLLLLIITAHTVLPQGILVEVLKHAPPPHLSRNLLPASFNFLANSSISSSISATFFHKCSEILYLCFGVHFDNFFGHFITRFLIIFFLRPFSMRYGTKKERPVFFL